MEGGQNMTPQTAHLTHFYTNTAAGGKEMLPQSAFLTHFYANTMAGGKEMIPQTAHLTHFYTNTAAGGALNVSPDSLLRKYRGRRAGNDTPDLLPHQ